MINGKDFFIVIVSCVSMVISMLAFKHADIIDEELHTYYTPTNTVTTNVTAPDLSNLPNSEYSVTLQNGETINQVNYVYTRKDLICLSPNALVQLIGASVGDE